MGRSFCTVILDIVGFLGSNNTTMACQDSKTTRSTASITGMPLATMTRDDTAKHKATNLVMRAVLFAFGGVHYDQMLNSEHPRHTQPDPPRSPWPHRKACRLASTSDWSTCILIRVAGEPKHTPVSRLGGCWTEGSTPETVGSL